MSFWKTLGQGALSTLTGGLISGGVGAGLGALTSGQAQKNALGLLKQQEEAQRRLNEENAARNYEFGEAAAENANNRAVSNWQMQNEYNSPEQNVERLKDAGLNVGLLYSGGAGGAGGTSVGGAAQGGGAGTAGNNTPNYLEVQAAKQQAKLTQAELTRTANESRLIAAEEEKLRTETEKAKQETERSKQLTVEEKALLNQQAVAKFIENAREQYKNLGEKERESKYTAWREHLGTVTIDNDSIFTKEVVSDIAKTVSEIDLNTEKKKTIYRELLVSELKGESEKVKANAIKLAAEWATGEYTNWKTWTEEAKKATSIITDLIGKAQ